MPLASIAAGVHTINLLGYHGSHEARSRMKSLGLLRVRDDLIRRCLFHPTAAVWEKVSALSQVGGRRRWCLACVLAIALLYVVCGGSGFRCRFQEAVAVFASSLPCDGAHEKIDACRMFLLLAAVEAVF